jgi:hypothetical protein
VAIARIFVLHRTELDKPEIMETLQHQQSDGIAVRVAFYEDLAFSGRDGIEMPTNCVIFDENVLIVRTPLLGIYYGKKSHDAEEIARYKRTYDIFDQHARPFEDLVCPAPARSQPIARAS